MFYQYFSNLKYRKFKIILYKKHKDRNVQDSSSKLPKQFKDSHH